MTLPAIVTMLGAIKKGIMDQNRILEFINKRNIDFDATPANVSTLMNAGAGPELIDKVSALRPPPLPPPPPPPPKPITGTLRFNCDPAECLIRVDGGPDKTTAGGSLSIGELVYKTYTIDFRKEGYMPKSEKITVSSETAPVIKVTLELKPETRALWGNQLYISAVQALGGANGLAEFKAMTSTGGASSIDEKGSQSEWTIKTTFSGDTNLYELSNPTSGSYAISCQDETCVPGKTKGKKASGPLADALNTNLRQYNRYRLITLMQRLKSGNYKFEGAAVPVAGAPSRLIAKSADGTYSISLDATNVPTAVTYHSSDSLVSAEITYGDYKAFGTGGKYPHLTSILLPGDKKHGIRVQYDSVTAGK